MAVAHGLPEKVRSLWAASGAPGPFESKPDVLKGMAGSTRYGFWLARTTPAASVGLVAAPTTPVENEPGKGPRKGGSGQNLPEADREAMTRPDFQRLMVAGASELFVKVFVASSKRRT